MKTIEEKARAYDEAIRKLRGMMPNWERLSYNGKTFLQDLIYIIPELAESEDEKVRKEIVGFLDMFLGTHITPTATPKQLKGWIAWLEKQGEHANFRNKIQIGDKVTRNEAGVLVNLSQLKRVSKPSEKQGEQKIEIKTAEESLGIGSDTYNKIVDECLFGEQKPADKVEPKFKVGDFIVNDYCMGRVVEITNDAYLLDTEQGIPFSCHSTRLWDVTKDAKNGDVLADYAGVILFRKIGNERYADVVDYYCVANTNGRFEIQEKFGYWGETNDAELHPATKEQRDLLFQKMNEECYEWDAEKKELKKIEQNPAWSEEDEKIRKELIGILSKYKYFYSKEIAWLKSLRPQNKWKPSDEQIVCLEEVIKHKNLWGSPATMLNELLADLKKLKEGEV